MHILCTPKYAEPLVILLPWSPVSILNHKLYQDDTLIMRGVFFFKKLIAHFVDLFKNHAPKYYITGCRFKYSLVMC